MAGSCTGKELLPETVSLPDMVPLIDMVPLVEMVPFKEPVLLVTAELTRVTAMNGGRAKDESMVLYLRQTCVLGLYTTPAQTPVQVDWQVARSGL